MCTVLPTEIVERKKQGFAIPLDQWFRKDLREMAYETLFSRQDGILEPDYLRKIWDEHQKRRFDRSAYLWAVLMFRKWQETFLPGKAQ